MKKTLIGILALAIVGGVIGYKIYNKPHADIASEEPEFVLTASKLHQAYRQDENSANEKYLGKIIEITGEISNVRKEGNIVNAITLNTGDMLSEVSCLLDVVDVEHRKDFTVGQEVRMRCICTGKLMDVELNRCVEIK